MPGGDGLRDCKSKRVGLYAFPSFLLLLLAVVVAPVLACVGQWFVHRKLNLRRFFVDNDVAGFIIAVVGSLYAVLLGFMTVIVWTHYEAARLRVWDESASVADVWHDAVGLPPALSRRVRHDMLEYSNTMIDKEWPAMRSGGFSVVGDELIMDAATVVGQFAPKTSAQSNAQAAIIERLNEVHDARGARLASNADGMPAFQWAVLWIGAIVVLAFCYLFSVSHLNAHMLMTGSVSVLIATMFVLIFELQLPFRTDIGIKPQAWQALIVHIHSMDKMPNPMSM